MNLFISGLMFLVAAFVLMPLVVLFGLIMWAVAGFWSFPIFLLVGIYAIGLFIEKVDEARS